MKVQQSRICTLCYELQFIDLDHRMRGQAIRMKCEGCERVEELRPVASSRPQAGGAA